MEIIQPSNPEHSNRKTILLAAAAIVVTLIFLFIAILIINSGGNSTDSKNTEGAVPDDSTSNNPQYVTRDTDTRESESVPNGWKTYKNSNFRIHFPSTWKIQELSFTNGDTGISIQPRDFSPKKPLLMVVRSNRSPAVTAKMQQAFIDLGFESSDMPVDNVQARRLNGTIPPKTASASAAVNFTQVNHIFFERADSDYLIKYTYTSGEIDQSIEKSMDEIISSFKFI